MAFRRSGVRVPYPPPYHEAAFVTTVKTGACECGLFVKCPECAGSAPKRLPVVARETHRNILPACLMLFVLLGICGISCDDRTATTHESKASAESLDSEKWLGCPVQQSNDIEALRTYGLGAARLCREFRSQGKTTQADSLGRLAVQAMERAAALYDARKQKEDPRFHRAYSEELESAEDIPRALEQEQAYLACQQAASLACSRVRLARLYRLAGQMEEAKKVLLKELSGQWDDLRDAYRELCLLSMQNEDWHEATTRARTGLLHTLDLMDCCKSGQFAGKFGWTLRAPDGSSDRTMGGGDVDQRRKDLLAAGWTDVTESHRTALLALFHDDAKWFLGVYQQSLSEMKTQDAEN